MSDEMIVKHCSPTLAGLKTGSMFSCFFSDKNEMNENIRMWNRIFVKKGLRVIPLRYKDCRALIYIYRPKNLACDLKDSTASGILFERGYDTNTPTDCIIKLIKKLNMSEEFPHEVGLFLGYPPEDVCGFIENKACNSKYVGCWKVYGNAEAAKKLFDKFKKCTDVYRMLLANGRPIEQLAVAG